MRLFTLFGIEVRIDRTFWLLPFVFSLWTAYRIGPGAGLRLFVLILCVFACVLGHEFAHGLRALSLGIRVPAITLYPMGGVASMLRIPKNPWQEFSISIVGPFFNFALAALLYYPLLALIGRDNLFSPSLDDWPRTFAHLFWVNPLLGAFNLVPAFPMDGGRMLRSLLAWKLDYLSATRISVFFGRFFAILFFLLGVWKRHWMLMLVGVYVFFAASNEMRQVLNERS